MWTSSRIIDLALTLCVLFLIIKLCVLKNAYSHSINQTNFTMTEAGLRYKVWHKEKSQSTLYIGGLLGTNMRSAKEMEQFVPPSTQRSIVVPSIYPILSYKPSNDIILVDNFCLPNWESVKSHAWYQDTRLSPGPYCFSETQTLLIDRLIKQYNIQHVKILADNTMNTHMIETFLKYLDHMRIHCDIIHKLL